MRFPTKKPLLREALYVREVLPPTEAPSDELYSDKQMHRLSKRKVVVDQLDANRQDFFSGEFEGFVPLATRRFLRF